LASPSLTFNPNKSPSKNATSGSAHSNSLAAARMATEESDGDFSRASNDSTAANCTGLNNNKSSSCSSTNVALNNKVRSEMINGAHYQQDVNPFINKTIKEENEEDSDHDS